MKKIVKACAVAALCVPMMLHAADKKMTIAGIVFQEDQFMKTVLMGMKSVADKNNVTLLTSNTSNQITKEVQIVNTYAARGVDAITQQEGDAQHHVFLVRARGAGGARVFAAVARV